MGLILNEHPLGIVMDGDALRPTWHDYFTEIAAVVAKRATCPRAHCGAVLVSPDNRILGTGYNGSAPGEPHCMDVGCLMEDGHCQRALHAEVNAIAFAARHGVRIEGARIYVAGPRDVCRECAKVLKAAGVSF